MKYILLKKYKGEVIEDFSVDVKEEFPEVHARWVTVIRYRQAKTTRITIHAPYKTDFASGPTIDTDSTKVPAVIHDALYELIRCKLIDGSYRDHADKILRELLISCGCWGFRARYWFYAVRIFGKAHLNIGVQQDKVYEAPEPCGLK